jgi:hypothetical protein
MHGTGSQRWASQSGKSHTWILEHYYPGATVMKVGDGGGAAIVVDSNPASNDAAKARVEYVGTWTSSTATPGLLRYRLPVGGDRGELVRHVDRLAGCW